MEYIEEDSQDIVEKLPKQELLDMMKCERPKMVLEREQNSLGELKRCVEGRW